MVWLSLVAALTLMASLTTWESIKLQRRGAGLVLTGNVLALSLVALAMFARLADGLAVPVLRMTYLGYVAFLAFLAVFVWRKCGCDTSKNPRGAYLWPNATVIRSLAFYVFFPLLAALLMLQGLAKLTPVFGWDALDWWALSAQRIISFDIETLGLENWSRLERWTDRLAFDRSLLPDDLSAPIFFGGRYPQDHYHPVFFSYLLAIFSEGQNFFQTAQTSPHELSAIYFVAYYSMLAGVISICFQSVRLSVIALCGVFSIPLVENHFVLVGYTELLIGLSIMGWASCIFVGVVCEKKYFIFLGLVISILPVILKNSGWGYTLSAFAGTSLLVIRSESRTTILVAVAVFLGVIALVVHFLGNLDVLSSLRLRFMGRQFNLGAHSVYDVFRNLGHAIFINTSFSVLATLSICCLPLLTKSENCKRLTALAVFFGFSLTFLAIIILSTLTVPYLYDHSTSSNDTGLSRSLIPLFSVLTLIAVVGSSEVRVRDSIC